MKYVSKQKTENPTHSNRAQFQVTQHKGEALKPPASGIDVVDTQTIQRVTAQQSTSPTAASKNKTGLPDNLKTGIEALSGYAMDDVKVHYNSSKPAQLYANAYAQGTNIYLASGQEKHLPHEAWHVVQQKQGRVKPTLQMKGMVNVNDEARLEKEADRMGRQAEKLNHSKRDTKQIFEPTSYLIQQHSIQSQTAQLNATDDLLAAQQNQAYLVAETANLNTSGNKVYAVINGAPAGAIKNKAAEGLRYYWQTMIDGFDGKKAEMYEAELLSNNHHIPILSTNDFTDPDVRTETGGNVIATEVKTINSDNTGNVNTLIKGADHQLGKRAADTRKIKIRIESVNNLWPDVRYNNINYITNDTELRNLLTNYNLVPHLEHADEIQIEGINVPYGGGGRKNFAAEIKGNGEVKKTSALVW